MLAERRRRGLYDSFEAGVNNCPRGELNDREGE